MALAEKTDEDDSLRLREIRKEEGGPSLVEVGVKVSAEVFGVTSLIATVDALDSSF